MVWFCQFHIAVLINSFRNLRTPKYSYLRAFSGVAFAHKVAGDYCGVLTNSFKKPCTPKYSYLCALFRRSLSLAKWRAMKDSLPGGPPGPPDLPEEPYWAQWGPMGPNRAPK